MNTIKQKVKGNNNVTAGGNLTYVEKLENLVEKTPTKLGKYVAELSKKISEPAEKDLIDYNLSEPKNKIEYNDIVEFKPLIDSYGIFGCQVENACDSLDIDTPNTKAKLLRFIHSEYLKTKGKYFKESNDNSHGVIRKNADNIIRDMRNCFVDIVMKDINISNIDKEDLIMCIDMLLVKSFIDCKILEKPIKK